MYKGTMYNVQRNNGQCTKKEQRLLLCEPAGARTQDPILKRDVLYLLSY